ncbi:hypothetical protein RUM43_002012, partial [Polyplax serrata]
AEGNGMKRKKRKSCFSSKLKENLIMGKFQTSDTEKRYRAKLTWENYNFYFKK